MVRVGVSIVKGPRHNLSASRSNTIRFCPALKLLRPIVRADPGRVDRPRRVNRLESGDLGDSDSVGKCDTHGALGAEPSEGSSLNIFRNCVVVCEVTVYRNQVFRCARRGAPRVLRPQTLQEHHAIPQKVLASIAQRQARPAKAAPVRPAQAQAISTPRQMLLK